MTYLIAALSTGKGTWGHVSALIRSEDWEKIYIITNDFGKEKFTNDKPFETIILNDNMSVEEMRDIISESLKGQLKMDVAVNFISGTGKEHMALMSALMKMGVGIRLVVEKDGMKEL